MSIWLIVMVIYAISNRVTDLEYLWKFSLLPALFLGLLAVLATFLGQTIRVKKGINWIFLLAAVAVDQAIKAYLFSLEWESISIPLIKPVFYIEPTQNTLGSYLWVLLRLKQGSHLLNMIHDSFMSRPNTICVPGGKMGFAMELVLNPVIHDLIEQKRKV